ncbi:alpha-mannosidase [Actinotalea subterranea]|uniref:glycoside hydrolase family 38 N-terminal domain-containing protein n=1 Tax=Actinotalea subterranea TaxID=2607497 RepID=UPI0011EC2DCE|nr:alpha-mannosidase [Actinotalea subterranea]
MTAEQTPAGTGPAAPTPATPTPAPEGAAPIVVMPHTHWDREWYEPHDVFRLRLVHVLDDVVARLERDPEFRFTMDGQVAAIDDYLEIRPEQRERVAALVRAGRLAVGPFLILLDEFCCDGETIVRNLELGLARAEALGGAMQVGYLPDMFGHAAQMPQMLRGFGIQHAALWRGVPDAVREHAFAWSAPDGSTVRCEYLFDGYGSGLDMFALPGRLGELAADYRRRTRPWYGDDPVLAMYGTDHMAPPADFMDRVREHNARSADDVPTLRVATLTEYVAERPSDPAALAALPAVRGELRSHARGNLLPGVFSIRTNLKAAMAQAELALTRAERLDALYSPDDHRAFFDLGWYRVVESSAHDSVTGCGVDATADQVGSRLATAASIGRAVTERVAGHLARRVPSDAHLVLNTLPWPRTVQVEVVTPEAPEGVRTQPLVELGTALGDERLATQDLARLLRRIHGRELFGQLITGYTWGPQSLHLEVAEVAEGEFDLPTLTAEIEAAMQAPDAAQTAWHVVTTARARRRVLLEVEVPPLGHVPVRTAGGAVTGGAGTAGEHSQHGAHGQHAGRGEPIEQGAHGEHCEHGEVLEVGPTRLRSDLVDVRVEPDGTLTVTGADGTVLHGVGRLVDEGDRGDSYNYGPLAAAGPVDEADEVRVEVVESGPLRGVLAVERRYRLPTGVDADDRDRRSAATAPLTTTTRVELRAGEPFVRLTLDLVNTVRDHRLRLHVPLGERVEASVAAGQMGLIRRGRTAEGGWGEYPLPTFPATVSVSAGRAHVLLGKLTEYEVVAAPGTAGAGDSSGRPDGPPDGQDELALTVLRAVGMMSVNVHPLRDEPAGSEIPVPGAQYLGTTVTTRLAVMPRADADAADVARWAEHFRHEPVVFRGSGPAGGPLPAAVAGPQLEGPAVMTSLRRVAGGALEARLLNVSEQDADVTLSPPPEGAWHATDLRGRRVDAPGPSLPAHGLRTLRTAAPAGAPGPDRTAGADHQDVPPAPHHPHATVEEELT